MEQPVPALESARLESAQVPNILPQFGTAPLEMPHPEAARGSERSASPFTLNHSPVGSAGANPAAVSSAPAGLPALSTPTASLSTVAPVLPSATILPQDCSCGGACGTATPTAPSYIYAIGNIRAAYPSLSVEREFYQDVALLHPTVPDSALPYTVLSQGENLYLAREICWVLQIDGADQVGLVDAYIILPRTYVELYNIILDLDPATLGDKAFVVVIGPRGPIAASDACGGLQLPTVVCNQIYSFTFNGFVAEVVAATGVSSTIVSSMFSQMLQMTDNAGETDEHRAINYITLRYPAIYSMAAQMLTPPPGSTNAFTLTSISAQLSLVQGIRKLVDVIFNYQNRVTGELVHWFCRVDVTGQFPFLVRPLSPYYPHP